MNSHVQEFLHFDLIWIRRTRSNRSELFVFDIAMVHRRSWTDQLSTQMFGVTKHPSNHGRCSFIVYYYHLSMWIMLWIITHAKCSCWILEIGKAMKFHSCVNKIQMTCGMHYCMNCMIAQCICDIQITSRIVVDSCVMCMGDVPTLYNVHTINWIKFYCIKELSNSVEYIIYELEISRVTIKREINFQDEIHFRIPGISAAYRGKLNWTNFRIELVW